VAKLTPKGQEQDHQIRIRKLENDLDHQKIRIDALKKRVVSQHDEIEKLRKAVKPKNSNAVIKS
jgi:uncharacterized coiled-coil protein SlyX